MKPQHKEVTNTTSFSGKTVHGKVNSAKLSQLIPLLIRNYNQPEIATVREWVSNAHDSHKSANQTLPIKVYLPTRLNPTLTVQDFGLGMSYEEVCENYLSLLSTTKDESDQLIGGYGIGGKSALALSDQYTIEAVKDGLLNVFIVERSKEFGITAKPAVQDSPTDRPNGVKVSVTMNSNSSSERAYGTALAGWKPHELEMISTSKEFFTSVYTDAIEFEHGLIPNKFFDFNEAQSSQAGHYYYSSSHNRSSKVLVGPIAYSTPAKASKLIEAWGLSKQNDSHNRSYRAQSFNYCVKMPIGSVTLPSSREVIEDTEENAEAIFKAYKMLYKEAKAHVRKIVTECKTLEEAYRFSNSPSAMVFAQDFKFKGRSLVGVKYTGETLFRFNSRAQFELIDGTEASAESVQWLVKLETADDAGLSNETYRKHLRNGLMEKISSNSVVMFTSEDDELHSITSKAITFADLKELGKNKAKSAPRPVVTDEDRRESAGKLRVAVLPYSQYRKATLKDLVESDKKPIMVHFTSESKIFHSQLQSTTQFLELMFKNVFPDEVTPFIVTSKLMAKEIKRAYPEISTLQEFLQTIPKAKKATLHEDFAKARKLTELVSSATYARSRELKALITGVNHLASKKLLSDEVLEFLPLKTLSYALMLSEFDSSSGVKSLNATDELESLFKNQNATAEPEESANFFALIQEGLSDRFYYSHERQAMARELADYMNWRIARYNSETKAKV